MSQWLLTSIEIGLNRLIPLDPVGEQRILAIDKKSISFTVTEPTIEATLLFNQGQVTLFEGYDPTADARVQGSAKQLIKLNLNEAASPVGSGVRMSGDHQLLVEFQTFIRSLNIDFEEPLSNIIGDIAAHQVGQFTRSLFGWAKRTSSILRQTGEQFISNEFDVTARPEAIAQHLNEVDALQTDTERLAIRIARLQRALEKQSPKKQPSETILS